MSVIVFIIIGLIAGLLARAIVPGRNSMGWIATIVLGIVGSLVGGFLASLVNPNREFATLQPAGIIVSTLGAIVVLVIAHLVQGRRRIA